MVLAGWPRFSLSGVLKTEEIVCGYLDSLIQIRKLVCGYTDIGIQIWKLFAGICIFVI